MMPLIAWMTGSKPGRRPSGPMSPKALIDTVTISGLMAASWSCVMPSRLATPMR